MGSELAAPPAERLIPLQSDCERKSRDDIRSKVFSFLFGVPV
ncbi:hypothetical protein [Rubripirellula tenax]|nr:hypothetical protein [Rubripirellula tenax]